MRGAVRSVVVVVALVATTLVGVAVSAGPAAATSTMKVTPVIGLTDGASVSVTVTGGDVTRHIITVCDSGLPHTSGLGVWTHCVLPSPNPYTDIAPGTTATVPLVVRATNSAIDGLSFRCGVAPGDCYVADVEVGSGITDVAVGSMVQVSFFDAPMASATPAIALPPSATVELKGTAFEPRTVLIRECSAAWAAAPNAATIDDACGNATSATPSDGAVSANVPVSDPLITVSGASLPCGFDGCVLAAGYDDEPVATTAPIAFSRPSAEISPTTGVTAGVPVQITVTGLPVGEVVDLAVCPKGDTSRCHSPSPSSISITGNVTRRAVDLGAGHWVSPPFRYGSCQEQGCDVLLRSRNDPGYLRATVPVAYAPFPELQLDADENLVPGQDVHVRGVNLTPGAAYQVSQCTQAGDQCDVGPTLLASPDGEVHTTLQITQDPGRFGYCRYVCSVHLKAIAGGAEDLEHPYTWTALAYSASPRTGLHDGDAVTVTGTGIRPEYVGSPVFLPTGRWAVEQCSRSMAYSATLVDLFTQCGIPDGGGAIAVPGTTVSATVRPSATIRATFGGTYDCRAASARCQLVLSRWEQDGTVTVLNMPIAFAP